MKETGSLRVVQSFRKAGTSGYNWMPSGKKLYYTSETELGNSVMVYDFDFCKGCGICANECPVKAIEMIVEGKE